MLTKEEIVRADKAHRRADEYAEQIKAGHLITECIVLHADENDGHEARWTVAEVEAWPQDRKKLIARVNFSAKVRVALFDEGFVTHGHADELEPLLENLRGNVQSGALEKFVNDMRRGRVMYRESAAFRAGAPQIDPYTRSDVVGLR